MCASNMHIYILQWLYIRCDHRGVCKWLLLLRSAGLVDEWLDSNDDIYRDDESGLKGLHWIKPCRLCKHAAAAIDNVLRRLSWTVHQPFECHCTVHVLYCTTSK